MSNVLRVEAIDWKDAETSIQAGCAALWDLVWPSEPGEPSLARRRTSYEGLRGHQIHVGLDDDLVVSVARTFEHTVDIGGSAQPVIALASVCSHPERRGEGWGALVAGAALARSSSAVPALFQTGVREFYEQLGSRAIPNTVITSAENVSAFTDTWVMLHPEAANWDDSVTVDLLTAGW